ncbi:hypothetical protein ACHWQZ_G019574 [Mnemiopsis leidyi]
MDYQGWSTFHHAAAANDIEILEDVINQEGFTHLESKTDRSDGHHLTPLLCAVKGNAVDTFNILISNGADISATDLNGHGVAELAVMFGSIDVFEHLLVNRYELKNVDVWQSLLTMLFRREEEENGTDYRHAALQMAEILIKREPRYIQSFIQKGGLASIRDLVAGCAGRTRLKLDKDAETENSKLELIKAEEKEEHLTQVYSRALMTFQRILEKMTNEQGKILSSHYKEIIISLVMILNKGSKDEIYQEESQLAGKCLEMIGGSGDWGVTCLANSCTLTSILRSILLDTDSLVQFQIIKTSYSENPTTLLENISASEIEVMLSIIETEKRVNIRKFFISLLKDFFQSGKSKHHMHGDGVIDTLLSGLSGPDTETTTISLDLLLLIAGDEAGVQAIFKSANSFSYLVNRVILETEDRFDKCTKLLWKLIQSFSNLQDSVKVIENIGITTVIRMLDSDDSEIVCIACEAIRILLSSDKHDYRAQLVRREVHLKLVKLLAGNCEGHVLYCVMTSLASLALSWSSLHPIPAVQNCILQHDCLEKLVQVAHTSKFNSAGLQSAAFLLIAATLLGNPVSEKRLSELDIDLEEELLKQNKHSEQSKQNAIKATSMFRYHALLMDNDNYSFRCRFASDTSFSLFNIILGKLSSKDKNSDVRKLLANSDIDAHICIATLSKLKSCAEEIVEHGLDSLIKSLSEGSLRVQEAAATAIASLSYCRGGVEQLLIETHEDPELLAEVARLSPNVPVSAALTSAVEGNSVREHRRRVLGKSNSSLGNKLPEISRSKSIVMRSSGASSPTKLREGSKTPVPGDKLLSKVETVKYEDITRMGLTRPYSKVAPLPRLLVEQNPGFKPSDPKLYSTVDRIYKKLYLRPATSEQSRPVTENKKRNRQQLARSLSFVF